MGDGVIKVIDQRIKWQYKNGSEASLITAAYGSHRNSVPGHTSIGCGRNFVHLVTGHTPGRINRNGTVRCVQFLFRQQSLGG